jgi:hypothetical protein
MRGLLTFAYAAHVPPRGVLDVAGALARRVPNREKREARADGHFPERSGPHAWIECGLPIDAGILHLRARAGEARADEVRETLRRALRVWREDREGQKIRRKDFGEVFPFPFLPFPIF